MKGYVFGIALLVSVQASAQAPSSVLCQMERVGTAGIGDNGKSESKADSDEGEIVLSGINTSKPSASGNTGNEQLQVVKRTADAVWLLERSDNGLADTVGVLTYFFRTKIILYSKQELLVGKPFGFIEIGRCRTLK